MTSKTALIIGAGPAGLTAAYEFLDKTDIAPIICEASDMVGGISRTVAYRGNRMDIGGHRFFSKSDQVMQWWLNVLPIQGAPAKDDRLLNRDVPLETEAILRPLGAKDTVTRPAPDPEQSDEVMLVRHRLSRILFLGKFFDYPVSLSRTTMACLGPWRILKIGARLLTRPPVSAQTGEFAGRLPDQQVRHRTLSHVLPRLYGKGVGRALP